MSSPYMCFVLLGLRSLEVATRVLVSASGL
jgi:hypothetical protein